jgi:hypothetical protein
MWFMNRFNKKHKSITIDGDTDWAVFAELVYTTAREMESLRKVGGPGYECHVNPELLQALGKYSFQFIKGRR